MVRRIAGLACAIVIVTSGHLAEAQDRNEEWIYIKPYGRSAIDLAESSKVLAIRGVRKYEFDAANHHWVVTANDEIDFESLPSRTEAGGIVIRMSRADLLRYAQRRGFDQSHDEFAGSNSGFARKRWTFPFPYLPGLGDQVLLAADQVVELIRERIPGFSAEQVRIGTQEWPGYTVDVPRLEDAVHVPREINERPVRVFVVDPGVLPSKAAPRGLAAADARDIVGSLFDGSPRHMVDRALSRIWEDLPADRRAYLQERLSGIDRKLREIEREYGIRK